MAIVEYKSYILNVQYQHLPPGSHGASLPNPDGSFTIFLDPNDSSDMQSYGFWKEVHGQIEKCHYDNIQDKDANQVELEAHDIPFAPAAPKEKKHKWLYTYFDLSMLRRYPCLREYFKVNLEDLPDEPLFPPKEIIPGAVYFPGTNEELLSDEQKKAFYKIAERRVDLINAEFYARICVQSGADLI